MEHFVGQKPFDESHTPVLNETHFGGIKLDAKMLLVIFRGILRKIVHCLGWCHRMTPAHSGRDLTWQSRENRP